MKNRTFILFFSSILMLEPLDLIARAPSGFTFTSRGMLFFLFIVIISILLTAAFCIRSLVITITKKKRIQDDHKIKKVISQMDDRQITRFLNLKRSSHTSPPFLITGIIIGCLLMTNGAEAREFTASGDSSLLGAAGIKITIFLVLVPILAGLVILIVKIRRSLKRVLEQQETEDAEALAEYLDALPLDESEALFKDQENASAFRLPERSLAGHSLPADTRGMLKIKQESVLPIVAPKKHAIPRPNIAPELSRLVLWFIGTAVFWLLFGTTIGEYLGIKFLAPDADHLSWLSFGRLRPVHTNAVFWGWASLAMLGLGHYIIPRVSNVPLYNIRTGWWSLWLINGAVAMGTICLMAGINNGGGEYREYVWPVMALFGAALVLSLNNFLRTVAARKTKEIYISSWYIVSSVIFALVITLVAYIPYWQHGLGETIIQGYYMHQGVGMWFMLFTLGIIYYFLPQQLNKPIYSYSLGILAFWSQILFYTTIGTHHFVFSSIAWWLQTVAIIGSVGMVIPVVAGTTNFILTFKGAWHKVADSYTLPFFLVGIVFYLTGSLQGTAEAFRFTNQIWHFTDFTVAHSHLTMYGIICFMLWGAIYAIVPRLTGHEAKQISVGAHFWMALVGLLFYTVPLMYGSTLKGLMWMQGKPFMDGVVFMAPYWLWRAIGGSLMWISHIFFAWNFYCMVFGRNLRGLGEIAIEKLENKLHKTN